jgi:hypothetical protein
MSYTPPINPTYTSAIGVNSDTAISGGNWTLGAGEQNDYSYVAINLQTDEDGTLTFEFSQDGTNWSEYPTVDFTVASGINEVHGAWKGTRYVRPKFVGTGGRSFFRLRTMYSYAPVTLSAPLNQPIGADSDAAIVKALNVGQNPTGSYVNAKLDGVAFQTVANLATGATFNSDVLDAQGYTQVQTHIVSDQDGTLAFKFGSTSNMSGTTVGENGVERYLTVPYSAADGFQLFSAPAFTPYVQYGFTNAGTGTTTQFMDSFISPSMIANLGRNVIVGQDITGSFGNVSTTPTSNESGSVNNLNIIDAHKPSDLEGRLRISEVITGVTGDFLQRTNTTDKKLFVTDILLTINNSDNAAFGRVNFRDGLTITGTTVLPILVQESPTNETAVQVVTHTFNEPMEFDEGLFIDIESGTLTITGTIMGYEE